MTKNSKIATTLSALTILTIGLTGAAGAQQLMPTATNSELNGSWVDANAARTGFAAEINQVAARSGTVASDAKRGTWIDGSAPASTEFGGSVELSYPSRDGSVRVGAVASEFDDGTWVDGSAPIENARTR